MPSRTYREYLKSRHWKRRRLEIFERANGLCEQCAAAPPQDVHHRNYLNIGAERDEDLIAVCRPCHVALEHAAGNLWKPRTRKPNTPKPHVKRSGPKPPRRMSEARRERKRLAHLRKMRLARKVRPWNELQMLNTRTGPDAPV